LKYRLIGVSAGGGPHASSTIEDPSHKYFVKACRAENLVHGYTGLKQQKTRVEFPRVG
jgi:hypothetical protein